MLGNFDFKVFVMARHPELDVSELSIKLGKPAGHTSVRGMPIVIPAGSRPGGLYPESRCLVELASSKNGTLAECISLAVDMLEPHKTFIDRVRGGGGDIVVFARWYPNGDTGETFPPEMLVKMGSLGVRLGFNVYGHHP